MHRRDPDRDWNPSLIEGERIDLRRHRPGNLPTVLRWYADPELARLTRYSLRPMPRDEVERFFQTRLLSTNPLLMASISDRKVD